MKKLIRTSLNNVANKRGVRDLNIQLYSHDKNNAGFEFVIKNEVDLSEYKAKVLFDFQESFATWETKGTVEGNVVKVKFDTTFITKCEEVIGYLFLDSETDTLDVFKFKFNVVLSEIDKYDTAKRGFRYIKDQEVVDVITRSELQEELAKLQVNGGVDLSNYLTTTVAEEIYAKKSDLPAPYNDSALVERVSNLENKTDNDTVYDDTSLKERVTALESKAIEGGAYDDTHLRERLDILEAKQDKDTVYDDAPLRDRVTTLENKAPVDLSNYVTKEELTDSIPLSLYETYSTNTLKETLDEDIDLLISHKNVAKNAGKIYVNKSIFIPKVFKGDVDNEKTVNLDVVMYSVANSLPDGYTLSDIENDINNKVTFLSNKNFSQVVPKEELKAIIKEVGETVGTSENIDISHFITEETLENKGYATVEQVASTYATKSEIPQPYSDTELVKRITVLENKQDNDTIYDDTDLKNRVVALENRPTGGGTQLQDTGWIKLSDETMAAGSIVEIRRIDNTVNVRFRNEQGNHFIVNPQIENNTILSKQISTGFGSVVNNSLMILNSDKSKSLGVVSTEVNNGNLQITIHITNSDYSNEFGVSVYINEFSYITDEPFPTNLH